MAGEITNGGLVTTRSNVLAGAPGSKKLPSRTSIRSATSLSAALNRVRPQRPLVHVGRDHLARVGGQVQRLDTAPGAEVERPLDRPRTVSCASEVAAELTPRTWSGGDPVGRAVQAGRQVAGHPQVQVVRGIGAYVDPRTDLAHRALEHPGGARAGRAAPGAPPRPRRRAPRPAAATAGPASRPGCRPSSPAAREGSRCGRGPRAPSYPGPRRPRRRCTPPPSTPPAAARQPRPSPHRHPGR